VATVAEIGAMKLAAIIDRGTRKDLVDLYYILQQVAIEDLFGVAAVKYSRVRTFAVSATRGLAYFDDAELLPMPLMIDRTPRGRDETLSRGGGDGGWSRKPGRSVALTADTHTRACSVLQVRKS
jgi:hypothetical protein